MIEAGVPGFEMASWQAVYAPRARPSPSSTASRRDRQGAEDARRAGQAGGQLGMELVGGTPGELAALMQSEIPRWAAS